jgi:hypothetical protein
MTEAADGNWLTSICGQCGEPIAEPRKREEAQPKPCPKCGSRTRRIEVHHRSPLEFSRSVVSSSTVQIEIVESYPKLLLNLARSLLEQGEGRYSIAVVVAYMACEIATERSLSIAFAHKGIEYLRGAVTDFFNGHNLANRRIQKLYTALTEDEIQKTAFWQMFKESSVRRNKIIHKGLVVSEFDAEKSYKAASDFLVRMGYKI